MTEERERQAGLYLVQSCEGSTHERGFLFAPAETSTLHPWCSKIPHILKFSPVVSLTEDSESVRLCITDT